MNLRVHDVREKVVIIHFATQLPGNSSPFLLKVEFRYGSTWPPTDGLACPQDGFSYFSGPTTERLPKVTREQIYD